ncbi:MBL fold metallo-hydrolase [Streptomyces sp. NPDC001980]|uniref:MBL fold metallo-hydrolase n=1 Tax=Streptomyces sp. NPDC001980 TaxID=3157126 RepID=UPI0033212243
MTSEPIGSRSTDANRRTFLRRASVVAAVPTGVGLFGAAAGTADAVDRADTAGLPGFEPVPAGSMGPALNADGYYVGRIKGNLYWVTDAYYQAMFLSTRHGVVLVDAPPTIGTNLLRAIEDVTGANGRPGKVTYLVHSHAHADHIGASVLFGDDVVRIGHKVNRELLLRAGDPNRPAPRVTFDSRYTLSVGGEHLELAYHGPNHAPDNIYVHAPAYQTLMLVDVLFPGWVPFKNLAVSQDIPAWIKAHDVALSYPWTTLVGGHLGRLGVRADGELQKEYMADLEAAVRSAVKSVDPAPYFREYGPAGNAWAIFRTYLDAVARTAADPVAAKYLGKLAAADVFTYDNAAALLESLRIDAGVLGPFGIRP